jgi:hypothetical protein
LYQKGNPKLIVWRSTRKNPRTGAICGSEAEPKIMAPPFPTPFASPTPGCGSSGGMTHGEMVVGGARWRRGPDPAVGARPAEELLGDDRTGRRGGARPRPAEEDALDGGLRRRICSMAAGGGCTGPEKVGGRWPWWGLTGDEPDWERYGAPANHGAPGGHEAHRNRHRRRRAPQPPKCG